MKIAAYQMEASIANYEARLEKIASVTKDSANAGANIIVFPELAMCGYGIGEAMIPFAKTQSDASIKKLAKIAEQHQIAIVIGLPWFENNKLYNSSVFIKPNGEIIQYHKQYLYGEYEKGLFVKGEAPPPIIEYDSLKFGLLICFDVEFPENVRVLAQQGVDMVLVPTALPKCDGSYFITQKMIPVRAFENQCFIAYADHAGRDELTSYQGCSCIVAPNGDFLAEASIEGDELLMAEIKQDDFATSRKENPYLDELDHN